MVEWSGGGVKALVVKSDRMIDENIIRSTKPKNENTDTNCRETKLIIEITSPLKTFL